MDVLVPVRAQPGDIVFVYNGGKGSKWTTKGQTFIRFLTTFKARPARYSHVALVVDRMLAIHASPGVVRVEPLSNIMPQIRRGSVRVARLAGEGLSPDEQNCLVRRAHFYLEQRYGFWFGQRSHPLGRLLRRLLRLAPWTEMSSDSRTMPFCSHLVADAYEHIGRSLTTLAADQTLPVDLDQACAAPMWVDVTDEYYDVDISTLVGDGGVADRIFGEFPPTADLNLELAADTSVLSRYTYEQVKLAADFLRDGGKLVAMYYNASAHLSRNARVYLKHDPRPFVSDISRASELYSRLEAAEPFWRSAIAAMLRSYFPGADPAAAPYEGFPTFAELVRLEQEQDLRLAVATTARLQTALTACLVGLRSSGPAAPGYDGLTPDDVLPLFLALSPLDEPRALRLMNAAEAALGSEAEEGVLRAMVINVVRLHLRLWSVREEWERSRSAAQG